MLNGDLGGGLVIPHEAKPKADIPIFYRIEEVKIRDGYPSITRTEIKIIRRSDEKILGRQVQYGRSGGDFPLTVSAPSHFVCPSLKSPLTQQVFLVEGSVK
jgi:hypothetical protein